MAAAGLRFDQSIAIVIGINEYGDGIAPLRTAVGDAEAIAQILEDEHGYRVELLLDGQATGEGLRSLIHETLPNLLTPNSRLLFYFAGHGIALDGDDGPAGYLIPQDARAGATESYLPMTWLHDALTALPCRHFLAVFDCCFAGAFRWSSTRRTGRSPEVIHRERFDRFQQDPAWQVITSASYDQEAWDVFHLQDDRGEAELGEAGRGEAKQQHSPFALGLMQALQGAADTSPPAMNGRPAGDGVITATELYLFLRDHVELLTEGRRKRQTPELCSLRNHDKGEFLFLTPGHALNLPPAPELNAANNPYRGLESFDQTHRDLFFGRQDEIEALYGRVVDAHPLTIVLGASGTGKSSLVKAGLLPRLADGEGFELLPVMRPGEQPLEALARVCAEVFGADAKELAEQFEADAQVLARWVGEWQREHLGRKLVLVVDQFEELVTQCREDAAAEQLQALLKQAWEQWGDWLHVVVTLRLDFEAQFKTGAWKSVWKASQFVIPPMSQAQLREAIEEPAAKRVLYFDPPSLVDTLVEDVGQTLGALPLLSFTLSELYLRYLERRSDNRALTEVDYDELGGVMGSLTQRATQEYEALVAEDAAYGRTVKNVMLRMVAVEGGELARRRVPRSELVYGSEVENGRVERLLERLIAARLVVQGQEGEEEPYVEPAHDALVRGWDKLLRWKKEEQEELVLQRQLTPQAVNWQVERTTGRQRKARGFLWNGNPRLDLLKEVWKSDESWLNALETSFVRRSLQRRRSVAGQLVGAGLAAIVALSGLAIRASNNAARAEKNEKEAQRQEEIAQNNANQAKANAAEARNNAAEAKKNAEEAQANAKEAEDNADEAKKQQKAAEDNLAEAQKQEKLAQENAAEAEAQAEIANENAAEAQKQTDIARKEAERANKQTVIAKQETQRAREQNAIAGTNAAKALFSSGRMLESLIEATRVAQLLKRENIDKPEIFLPAKAILQQNLYPRLEFNLGEPHAFQERNRLVGHEDTISVLSFSPNGQYIASGSDDSLVKIWDVQGKLLFTLAGHEDQIRGLEFSPDSQSLASASYDGIVKIWNLKGQEIDSHSFGRFRIRSIDFHPDGKRIALAGDDSSEKKKRYKVMIFDLEDKSTIDKVKHKKKIRSIEFSRNGDLLASASDENIEIISLKNEKSVSIPDSKGVLTVSFSPDSKKLVTGGKDLKVRLWDVNGQALSIFPEKQDNTGHQDSIFAVDFSPDGKTLLSSSNDSSAKLWDFQTKRSYTLLGHLGGVFSASFSPDGQTIATAGEDSIIRIWQRQTNPLVDLSSHGDFEKNIINFSSDGNLIATGGKDSIIRLWNSRNGKVISSLTGHKGAIRQIKFSSSNERIIATHSNGESIVRLWTEQGEALNPLQGHDKEILSFDISPGGHQIVTGGADSKVILWNLRGEKIEVFPHKTGPVKAVKFSPDGKYIFTAGEDSKAIVWSRKGKHVLTLPGLKAPARQIETNNQGNLVAILENEGKVRVWNLLSKKYRENPYELSHPQQGFIGTMAFSPDLDILATGATDNTVKIWNSDGEEIASLLGHKKSITSIDFSPDSKIILTGSRDKSIKLWDRQGRELASFQGHQGPVSNAKFNPLDASFIASTSDDRSSRIVLWDNDFDSLLRNSCEWLQPYLETNLFLQKSSNKRMCDVH